MPSLRPFQSLKRFYCYFSNKNKIDTMDVKCSIEKIWGKICLHARAHTHARTHARTNTHMYMSEFTLLPSSAELVSKRKSCRRLGCAIQKQK